MLSRQQIRQRKRQLEKVRTAKRNDEQTLQELNDAERLHDSRQAQHDQLALQTGSLCVAILSQIPEHRGAAVHLKAEAFITELLTQRHADLTTVPEDEEDDEDEENENGEPALQAL